MVGIMLVVIHPFNFFKAEIRLLRVFPKVVGGKTPVTVPVHILSGTLSVNVFAVFYIEPTVIVPGIVSAMLPRASIVSCQFQTFFLLPAKMFRAGEGGKAARPAKFCVR